VRWSRQRGRRRRAGGVAQAAPGGGRGARGQRFLAQPLEEIGVTEALVCGAVAPRREDRRRLRELDLFEEDGEADAHDATSGRATPTRTSAS